MAADSTWQTNRTASSSPAVSSSSSAGSGAGTESASPTSAAAAQKTYDRFIELDDLMEFCMEMWVREDFHLGAQLTRALGERLLAKPQKDRFGIALLPLAGPLAGTYANSGSGSGTGSGGGSSSGGSGGNNEALAGNAATPLGVTQFAFSHAASLQSGAAAAEIASAAAAAALSATSTEILQSPGSGSASASTAGLSAGTPAASVRRNGANPALDSAAGGGGGGSESAAWSKANMARCTLDAFAAAVAPMAPHWVRKDNTHMQPHPNTLTTHLRFALIMLCLCVSRISILCLCVSFLPFTL